MPDRTGSEQEDLPTVLPLVTADDVLRARPLARLLARVQGLSLLEQTLLVTATTALSTRTTLHGQGGTVQVEPARKGICRGIKLALHSHCTTPLFPGKARTEGCPSNTGSSRILSGVRRLMDDFRIDPALERGPIITATKWAS